MPLGTYSPGTTYDSPLVREELVDPLRVRVQARRDVLSMFLDTGQAFKASKYDVVVETGYFLFGTLGAAISTSTSAPVTLTITKSAVFPLNIKTGTVLVIGTGFAAERFVALQEPTYGSTTISVYCARGANTQFNTSPATAANGSYVYIEGAITPEGWEPGSRSDHMVGVRVPCVTEIIDPYVVIMSGTAIAEGPITAGGDNKMDVQITRGMDYMLNLLQAQIIRRPYSIGGPTNSTTGRGDLRTMRSMLDFATNYNGNAVNGNSASITTDLFDDAIEETVLRAGIIPRSAFAGSSATGSQLVCLISDRQKKGLNRQLAGRIRQDRKDTTLSNYVGTYEGEAFVDLYTLPIDTLRRDEFILLPKDIFRAAAHTSRAMKERKFPEGLADKDTRWVLGEYGTQCDQPALITYYWNLNTSY